jgi:hypothetical protein
MKTIRAILDVFISPLALLWLCRPHRAKATQNLVLCDHCKTQKITCECEV